MMQMAVFGGSTRPGQGIPSIRLIYHQDHFTGSGWLIHTHGRQAQPPNAIKKVSESPGRIGRQGSCYRAGSIQRKRLETKPDISRKEHAAFFINNSRGGKTHCSLNPH